MDIARPLRNQKELFYLAIRGMLRSLTFSVGNLHPYGVAVRPLERLPHTHTL